MRDILYQYIKMIIESENLKKHDDELLIEPNDSSKEFENEMSTIAGGALSGYTEPLSGPKFSNTRKKKKIR